MSRRLLAPKAGTGGGTDPTPGSSWEIVSRNAAGSSTNYQFTWADMSGAAWQLTIPTPDKDAFVGVKIDIGGNPLTVVAQGGALIEGQASIVLEDEGTSLTLGANGTKWGIL